MKQQNVLNIMVIFSVHMECQQVFFQPGAEPAAAFAVLVSVLHQVLGVTGPRGGDPPAVPVVLVLALPRVHAALLRCLRGLQDESRRCGEDLLVLLGSEGGEDGEGVDGADVPVALHADVAALAPALAPRVPQDKGPGCEPDGRQGVVGAGNLMLLNYSPGSTVTT